MRHFIYLTVLTALWVVAVLVTTPKGPYWESLEDVDLYIRAAKYDVCRPASHELERAVRACVETPEPAECSRVPRLSEDTKRCLKNFEK